MNAGGLSHRYSSGLDSNQSMLLLQVAATRIVHAHGKDASQHEPTPARDNLRKAPSQQQVHGSWDSQLPALLAIRVSSTDYSVLAVVVVFLCGVCSIIGLLSSVEEVSSSRYVGSNSGPRDMRGQSGLAVLYPGRRPPQLSERAAAALANKDKPIPASHPLPATKGSSLSMPGSQVSPPMPSSRSMPAPGTMSAVASIPNTQLASASSMSSSCPSAPTSPFLPQTGAAHMALATEGPNILCPSLVLKNSECRFALAIESLALEDGSFEIYGLSGKPILHGTITSNQGGKQIDVSVFTQSTVLASVRECTDASDPDRFFDIWRVDKSLFGSMMRKSEGTYALKHAGSTCLSVGVDRETGHLQLIDNTGPFAWAFRVDQSLEIQVKAGVDPILVLACLLGTACFSRRRG